MCYNDRVELDILPADTDPLDDPSEVLSDSPSGLQCVVCATPLTYGGRGPKPKYCDEHRKNKSTNSVGGGRRSGKNVDTLVMQIQQFYIMGGMGMTMFPPTQTDGLILSEHSAKLAESWRNLLETNSQVRKFWEKMCSGGGWGAMIYAHSTVAVAIMSAHDINLFGSFGRKETA